MLKQVSAWFVGCWVAVTAMAESLGSQSHGAPAPYVPTPDVVVQEMLGLARLTPEDYLIDLGSGDGRIAIQAVRQGAGGLGVERSGSLVRAARSNAEGIGLGDRVVFLEEDVFDTDLSHASVVTLYLLPHQNLELRPKLLAQLRPGARVISHGFAFGYWEPDRTVEVDVGQALTRAVHMWVIPADVRGQWDWRLDGRRFAWRVQQQYQALETTLEADGVALTPERVLLRGRHVAFAVRDGERRYAFDGRIEDDRIEGTVRVQNAEQSRLRAWRARKQA